MKKLPISAAYYAALSTPNLDRELEALAVALQTVDDEDHPALCARLERCHAAAVAVRESRNHTS